ncbi:hypothetical protein ACQJBY_042284 [Aegilops geniculata]
MSSTEPCMDDRRWTSKLSHGSHLHDRHRSLLCHASTAQSWPPWPTERSVQWERSQAIRHLDRACQDWGFFKVINHGVPEALQSEMMDACKELFSLPLEQKQEHMDAGPMDPVRVGTGFTSSPEIVPSLHRSYCRCLWGR